MYLVHTKTIQMLDLNQPKLEYDVPELIFEEEKLLIVTYLRLLKFGLEVLIRAF